VGRCDPLSWGEHMQRYAVGSALQMVGAILLTVSVETLLYALAYPHWVSRR